jgi:hypothetical protein
VISLLVVARVPRAAAQELDETFAPMTKGISVEGALARYKSDRLSGAYINAWNVGLKLSLLPFGVIHNHKVLDGWLDGALELGVEPTFQRFNSVHQNFAGLVFNIKYYFVRLHYGPLVPWIGGAIGPGYSDLDIGKVSNDSKLTGPFMALIMGEVGGAWIIDSHKVLYLGLQAQHVSNGGFNGSIDSGTRNLSLNTPWGVVAGFSWYFR